MLKLGNYEIFALRIGLDKSLYQNWFRSLDIRTQARVFDRAKRLGKGQFGDYKKIDHGLYELRFFFGPGYRVYFGERRGKIILLLNGGDKASQTHDIRMAKQYWEIFQEDNQ